MFALCSSKKVLITALWATALVVSSSAFAQDDPPSEAGRISYISGNVSIQPANSEEWGQAYPNLPLGPGDRIFTDADGRAEVQLGQTYIRIGPSSDVTLVNDSQFNINIGVAQGSIRLHSFKMWPRQLLDVSTPNGNAEFADSGDLRVDVLPQDGATVFTNLGQFADITAAGNFRQELDNGQSLSLTGSNPVYPQWLQPAGPDDLDNWSQQRDQQFSRAVSFQYVSPDIPGASDLDANGDWQPQTEYGAVWFPRNVAADWQPYHYGHWIDRDPWGWVWVEDESWGYAPFHYGRWVSYNGRWGWVPGPVNVRPIWSPALVVFAGGVNVGGGGGLSVWFPLGPGEAYRPWYRSSPHYIDQVNITNIREAPRVRVQKTYVNIVNVTNVTYVNQTHGASAMRHDDFAAGRSERNVAVRVDAREMQQAHVLQQPDVARTRQSMVTRPVAHPVPVSIQRPMLINQQGKQIAAKPGATPVAPPVRPETQVRPLPGRTIVAAPAHGVQNRAGGNQQPPTQGNPEQRPNSPNAPYTGGAPRANPVAPVRGIQRPLNPQEHPNPPANNTYQQQPGQQPVQPTGRPAQAPNYKQQDQPYQAPNNNQHQQQGPQPIAPGLQPTGRPAQAPDYKQQDRPNYQQPGNPQQRRPDQSQPETRPIQPQPQEPRPVQPDPRPVQPQPNQPRPGQTDPRFVQPQPGQPRPNQPEPRPVQPQPQDPGQQQYRQQNRHNDQVPQQPNDQHQGRPTPPPPQQREIAPPPQQREVAPPPQQRETAPPPQRPAYQPQERQAPPPNHQADQPKPRPEAAPPQQQSKPQPKDPKQNNKDQKKDDKKHDQ